MTQHTFIQPGWDHVFAAFVDGAREARANPDASDSDFLRSADGYTKRVHEEVDPETERRLRENDWPPLAQHSAALVYTNRCCRLRCIPILVVDFYPKEPA